MQQSPCVPKIRQRSSSPVFFTGCTAALPKSNNQEADARTMSPSDFENLKQSVDSLKSGCVRDYQSSGTALLSPPPGVINIIGTVNYHLNPNHKPQKCSSAIEMDCERNKMRSMPLLQLHRTALTDDSSHSRESAYHPFYSSSHYSKCSPNTSRPFTVAQLNSRKRKRISSEKQTKFSKKFSPNSSLRYVWDQLSQDIWQLYLENKQTAEVYRMKMDLRDQLHHMLLATFPNCGLYVVGSSMTGLGANSSDMDMCLMLSHSEIDQEQEATGILQTVYETFIQYDFLMDVELIPAKVPILRFKDLQSTIEVDLNINNSVGIRNTQLLTSYSRIDDRVPPLVLLTKLWARCHGINDAKNHTLSSYSLVLMVIHYLQYGCTPPVLPCLQMLQPEKFQPHSDVRTLSLMEDLPPYESKNTEQLAELFLGFLDYFANKFDFANHVMSVRVGGVLPKHVSMNNTLSPKNKKGHWKHLCIEEPFNLTNTACSVFKDSAFYYMRDVFLRSWNMLKSSGNLGSILNMKKT